MDSELINLYEKLSKIQMFEDFKVIRTLSTENYNKYKKRYNRVKNQITQNYISNIINKTKFFEEYCIIQITNFDLREENMYDVIYILNIRNSEYMIYLKFGHNKICIQLLHIVDDINFVEEYILIGDKNILIVDEYIKQDRKITFDKKVEQKLQRFAANVEVTEVYFENEKIFDKNIKLWFSI